MKTARTTISENAAQEKIGRVDKTSLERECSKLDSAVEQTLADEGLSFEVEEWPTYQHIT
jgi:hypothetical protein